MSQAREAISKPAEAVAANIEASFGRKMLPCGSEPGPTCWPTASPASLRRSGFVAIHLAWFGAWAAINTRLLQIIPAFDPYPFQLLCMIVSMVLLATFVLIKQNRMSYLSDRRAHPDLQINLLAEREVTRLLRLTSDTAKKLQVERQHVAADLEADTEIETLMQEIDRRLKGNT
jgi:uncharacterized membrane protein